MNRLLAVIPLLVSSSALADTLEVPAETDAETLFAKLAEARPDAVRCVWQPETDALVVKVGEETLPGSLVCAARDVDARLAGRAYAARLLFTGDGTHLHGVVELYGATGNFFGSEMEYLMGAHGPATGLWRDVATAGGVLVLRPGDEALQGPATEACKVLEPITADELREAVRALSDTIVACAPNRPVALTFELRSDATGRLRASRFAGPDGRPTKCIARVLGTMRLDKKRLTCHPIAVQMPIAFE